MSGLAGFAPLARRSLPGLLPLGFAFGAFLLAPAAAAQDEPEASTQSESSKEGTLHRRDVGQGGSSAATSEEELEVLAVGQAPHPDRSAREPDVAASVIPRERLSQPGMGIAEALREEPGVQVTQAGGLGTPATARLRGATSSQTPVYLGDVRINDEVGGVADLSTVPAYLIERVEVYRGHSPRRLTELGVGGAIVLVPRRLQKSGSSLQVEVGSLGTRALRGRVGVRDGERRALAAVEVFGADNSYPFVDTRGTVFEADDDGVSRLTNADVTSEAVWLQASDRLGKAYVSMIAHFAHREQGAPKLALVPSEAARAEFARSLFAFSSVLPLEKSSLSLSTRAVFGETTIDDPQLELGSFSPRTSTPGERIEQVGEFRHEVGSHVLVTERLVVSVERLRRYERSAGEDTLQLAARRSVLRPSLLVDYEPLQDLHLDGVAALNCVSTTETQASVCEEGTFTGRASVRFSQKHWEVYSSLGRYQRLATLSELYGSGVLVRGNADLKPEVGVSPELGVRAQLGTRDARPLLWLDVSGFARYSTELVTYIRTAQGYLRPVNRDSSRTVGAELALGLAPVRGLSFQANASLLDARDTSASRVVVNDVLPFISPLTLNARVDYVLPLPTSEVFDSATLGFRIVHQSSSYADPAGLGVIPQQTFGDAEASVSLLEKRLVTKFRVSNVWDAQRFDIVGFPLPPRSVFLNMEILF